MADGLPRRHKASLTYHLHQRRLAHALNAFADQPRPGRWHHVGREGRRQSEQLKSFNVVLFLSVGIAIGMTRRGRHAKRLIGKIDHQLTQRIHIASVQSDSVDVIPRIADRIERERHDIVAIKGSRSIAEVRSRPQQPFRILYTGRSQPLDVAARCLQFRSPGYSYCTPRGRQRYGGAKRQELRAALVAFITISKCDDRPRAVMGDKAEEVRADCRRL